MTQVSYEALLRDLQKERVGGSFFLFGEETFLRDEAVDRIVAAYLDPATADFNRDQLRGSDVAAEALASVLATPPMMAEWRVVVVRDAQGLSVKAREVVEAHARARPAGVVLVLAAAIPAGSQAKFYTELKKLATSVEFSAVGELDAPGWVMERALASEGLEVEPEAARALVGAVGADLGVLSAELRKLGAFAAGRTRITLEDVRAAGVVVERQDRWVWFDLVGERKLDAALRSLPALLHAGENGVALVIGLTSQLLRIALVCAGGQSALERELKPYQRWLARRVTPQAKRWTLPEAETALAELLRTDRLLKSASLTDRQAIEELLLRLAAIAPRQGRAA